MFKRTPLQLMVIVLLLAATSPVLGLEIPLGPRAGLTSWDGIKQAHFGIHAQLGEVLPNVEFTPVFEMGFGDNLTLLSLHGDLAYQFTELTTAPWGMYAGGSLSMHYIDHKLLDGDVDLGLAGLFGFTYQMDEKHEVLAEVRIGLMDSPDFKITFGYTFF